MITLDVNGEKVEVKSDITIEEYLVNNSINPKTVVVELNFEVPQRDNWHKVILKEGDNLEIVKFIGGG